MIPRTSVRMALATALSVGGLLTLQHAAQAQERRFIIKGGETIEMYSVWSVARCRSHITAAPTVELLEGPPQLKLWVEPAMVTASRLNCTTPTPGGKLMATVGTVEQTIDTQITFRVIYKTTEGERQVGRVYNVSLYPGQAEANQKTAPSRTWKQFLASVGNAGKFVSDSRRGTRQQQMRRSVRRATASRVADIRPGAGAGPEALYAFCRRAIFRKYGWSGHDGKTYMWERPSQGMTDQCIRDGGKVP